MNHVKQRAHQGWITTSVNQFKCILQCGEPCQKEDWARYKYHMRVAHPLADTNAGSMEQVYKLFGQTMHVDTQITSRIYSPTSDILWNYGSKCLILSTIPEIGEKESRFSTPPWLIHTWQRWNCTSLPERSWETMHDISAKMWIADTCGW